MIKIGARCLQDDPERRPLMSTIVKILDGVMEVDTNLVYVFSHSLIASPITNHHISSAQLPASVLSNPRWWHCKSLFFFFLKENSSSLFHNLYYLSIIKFFIIELKKNYHFSVANFFFLVNFIKTFKWCLCTCTHIKTIVMYFYSSHLHFFFPNI